MPWMGETYSKVDHYFQQHSEQLFVLKAIGLVALLNILENVFYIWWLTILIFSPLFIWCLFQIISIHQNKGIVQVLLENLTLIPAPYLDQDRKYQLFPWVTYFLILTNIFIHYLVAPTLSESTFNNLLFVPVDMTFINVLVSPVSSIFLHGSDGHLWGNMAFLWAMGTVLEKRLGHGWLFGLYLASGVAGNLLFAVTGFWTYGYLPSVLGASGAIAGLMGVYAIRCYFKTMVFPFPVLGLFSFIIPISLKVRMNALVVIGLFFWADLSSGVDQVFGVDDDNVAYWCHIGGMLTGILLAYRMNLGSDALQEKRLDIARTALDDRNWLGSDVGEKAVREYLQEDESDPEAILLLARKISYYSKPEEGRDLYQKVVAILLKSDLKEALSVYREYFNKYLQPLQPELQFRMAVIAEKEGDDDFATRSLEMLLKEEDLGQQLRGKCLFHCARLCNKMGFFEAAQMYEEKLKETAQSINQ